MTTKSLILDLIFQFQDYFSGIFYNRNNKVSVSKYYTLPSHLQKGNFDAIMGETDWSTISIFSTKEPCYQVIQF